MTFNFGPIARTAAGGEQDTVNLAPLPLHVMLNALVGSTSMEEFVAWLWHDLYKPAFLWKNKNGKLSWQHIPGYGAFKGKEGQFASSTKVNKDLILTHHSRQKNNHQGVAANGKRQFYYREPDFISDQGDQTNLGISVHYLQLSILAKPSLATALLHAIIADSFIKAVTKDIAESLKRAFIKEKRSPIERVRFEFEAKSDIGFSSNPDEAEIWNKVGEHFDVVSGKTFTMKHLTPVVARSNKVFSALFTADLTGRSLTPREMLQNVFSLAELLTVYQDNQTIILAVPQKTIYAIDEGEVKVNTEQFVRERFDNLQVKYEDRDFDYLTELFNSQIEVREVPGKLQKREKDSKRPLADIVLQPAKLLLEKSKNSKCKLCRLTGTPYVSDAPNPKRRLDQIFSATFTDNEFVGLSEGIAPLSYLYVLNSYRKSRAFRGAFCLLTPASQFALDEHAATTVEKPTLDIGGRFSHSFNRVTVTTQEFTLFQQVSRRIIAGAWFEVMPNEDLPLPYLGAIFITDEKRIKYKSGDKQLVKAFVPKLRKLFSDVTLLAYPFSLKVKPAVELALEARISNSARHYTMHTLLKTKPQVTSVGSHAQLYIQLEDKEQILLSNRLFEGLEALQKVFYSLKRFKKKGKTITNQKDVWLKLILLGHDPITAVFESEKALIDVKKLPEELSLESLSLSGAERFWNDHLEGDSLIKTWDSYECFKNETSSMLEYYPYVGKLFDLFFGD